MNVTRFARAWVSFRFVNAMEMGGNPSSGPPKPLPPKSMPDFDNSPTPGGTIQTLEVPPPGVKPFTEGNSIPFHPLGRSTCRPADGLTYLPFTFFRDLTSSANE